MALVVRHWLEAAKIHSYLFLDMSFELRFRLHLEQIEHFDD